MADFDINQATFTGTVERFDRIATKTGTAMVKALVRCYKETVQVVAFRDLAEDTDLQAGDRVIVDGNIKARPGAPVKVVDPTAAGKPAAAPAKGA